MSSTNTPTPPPAEPAFHQFTCTECHQPLTNEQAWKLFEKNRARNGLPHFGYDRWLEAHRL